MACAAHLTPQQERTTRALDELEAKITELWGYMNAASYRFLTLVAGFDREKWYARHGLANTAVLAEQQASAESGNAHRCELENGPALALDTARRLACDASVVGIVEGEDGEPLDIGRKTRAFRSRSAVR